MPPDPIFDFLVRPAGIPAGQPGVLLTVTPEEAGWSTLGFTVRRLAPGDVLKSETADHETAIVVLGGKMSIDWGEGARSIGGRENVFSGYPYAVYLPCGTGYEVRAESLAEFAESRVKAQGQFKPRIMTPDDMGDETRGTGDMTRQIIRIIRPEHEADKLMMNEVYTPDGNWSSYPPHKHDTLNLPRENDLDEMYYFRVDPPDGFAFLRVYDTAGKRDATVKIGDGDLALLRDGYHMVAAAPGYRCYYLAVLAGETRSLAASSDPRFRGMRGGEPAPDPRAPVVRRS